MTDRSAIVVGLMSGTSADGVDAAVVRCGGEKPLLLGHAHCAYDGEMRRRLLSLAEEGGLDELCRLNFEIGETLARTALSAIADAGLTPRRVRLIGSHGHTVRHLPGRSGQTGGTLQIGEGSIIAERTGITTVCDFRPRDMAAGGEGAPLVPFFDYRYFARPGRTRIILNIGGIANLTAVNADLGPAAVTAFDTGPGNMVLDGLVRLFTDGALDYDRDGAIAAAGRVVEPLLQWALSHSFFALPPPKSTGREEFGREFKDRFIAVGRQSGAEFADLVATAAALTAASITEACRRHLGHLPPFDEVIVGGGGARNPVLLGMLRSRLGEGVRVSVVDEYGLPSEAKEAMAFALLAHEAAAGRVNNLPAATGAGRGVVMGKIIPGGVGLALM